MPSVQLPKKEALIVDDDVRARELLSEFCRGQGLEGSRRMTQDGHCLFGAGIRSNLRRSKTADRGPRTDYTVNVPAMNAEMLVNPIFS